PRQSRFLTTRRPTCSTPFPYTTLFRSEKPEPPVKVKTPPTPAEEPPAMEEPGNPPHMAQTGTDGMMAASAAGAVLITGGAMLYRDRKSTRLNSSHVKISYAVFCLKKKK